MRNVDPVSHAPVSSWGSVAQTIHPVASSSGPARVRALRDGRRVEGQGASTAHGLSSGLETLADLGSLGIEPSTAERPVLPAANSHSRPIRDIDCREFVVGKQTVESRWETGAERCLGRRTTKRADQAAPVRHSRVAHVRLDLSGPGAERIESLYHLLGSQSGP